MILRAGRQRRHSCKEQTFELSGRRREWDDLREQYCDIYVIIYKIDSQFEFDVWHRAPQSWCSVTTWRDRVGRRWRGFRMEGAHVCLWPIHVWCMAKTITIGETPIFWPPDAKNWLTRKDPDGWERLKAGGEGDDRGWAGWLASLTWWAWVWWTPGVGDGQGGLACCSPWGAKSRIQLSDWTELNFPPMKINGLIKK